MLCTFLTVASNHPVPTVIGKLFSGLEAPQLPVKKLFFSKFLNFRWKFTIFQLPTFYVLNIHARFIKICWCKAVLELQQKMLRIFFMRHNVCQLTMTVFAFLPNTSCAQHTTCCCLWTIACCGFLLKNFPCGWCKIAAATLCLHIVKVWSHRKSW